MTKSATALAEEPRIQVPQHIHQERMQEAMNAPDSAGTPKMLPVPTGYKILIGIPKIEDTTEGGIIKAEATKFAEEVMSVVGLVLDMGPDCYKDKGRFPSGEPYCKVGDFIVMRAYTGTRISIYGTEYRLINDDSVEAIVDDPRGILKV
jgi:co-chaperonin GroES (HSP10)